MDHQPATTSDDEYLHPQVSANPVDPLLIAKAKVVEKRSQQQNFVILALWNLYAGVKVFANYLISVETVLASILSGVMTALVYVYFSDGTTDNSSGWDGHMNWVLLTFAVVTPISVSINVAFKRREDALKSIALWRANAFQLFVAHSNWDWGSYGKNGRATLNYDFAQHSDEMFKLLTAMGDELYEFLTLPTCSRARHRVTKKGSKEAELTVEVAYAFYESVQTSRMIQISRLTEDLKLLGLPGNEAARMRQYEKFLNQAMEELRMIKMYRTPQALRSFARIFTLCLPPLYAPEFAQFARDIQSLGMGIFMSVFVSIALTALFNAVYILEDPFRAHLSLDGIDVHEELAVLHWKQLKHAHEIFFPPLNGSSGITEEEARFRRTSSYASLNDSRNSVTKKRIVQ